LKVYGSTLLSSIQISSMLIQNWGLYFVTVFPESGVGGVGARFFTRCGVGSGGKGGGCMNFANFDRIEGEDSVCFAAVADIFDADTGVTGALRFAAGVARGFGFATGLALDDLFAVTFGGGFGLVTNLRGFVWFGSASALAVDRGRFVEGGVGNNVACLGLAGVVFGRGCRRAKAEGSEEEPLLANAD